MLCLLILPMFLLVSDLSAQEPENWKSQLAKQLDSDGPVSYLHLVGYLDEVIYTDMYFAYDSADWTGWLYFPEVSIRFDMEGFTSDDKIVFNEYDADGRHSGYWSIQKELNRYIGVWSNPEQNMDFEITMYDAFWNPDFRKDYNKKISAYQGEFAGKQVQFDIVRQHEQLVAMEWFDMNQGKRLLPEWNCSDVFCKKFAIEPFEGFVASDTRLTGEQIPDGIRWELIKGSGKPEHISFALLADNITRVKTRLEWSHFLVVEYPVFEQEASKNDVDRWTRRIVDTLQTEFLKVIVNGDDSLSRWSNFATARFDIHYWDDYHLSGKWIIQRSWTNDQWALPVNYSIRQNEIIDIERQFKPDFDLDFFLDYFIRKKVTELPEYKDLLIRNKLKVDAFKYINFCKEGLLLSTDFDTLFGTFYLVVPYSEITEYLRKRSLLKKMLESRYDD